MDDAYAGQLVRCPTCHATCAVPASTAAAKPVSHAPTRSNESVRRFGFNCPWCSSRLEATMATTGQEGQCPTCGNNICIPLMDRFGRLIDPRTKEILKPDPHPVHAYAAAGDRAPKIVRSETGDQLIICSRCNAPNLVSADSCRGCGIPFTLEGTTRIALPSGSGFSTSSLILGLLGLPSCAIVVPSLLAIALGIAAMVQLRNTDARSSRTMAYIGITCGAIGVALFLMRQYL